MKNEVVYDESYIPMQQINQKLNKTISPIDDIASITSISIFREKVRKMKLWPNYDHIFRVARKEGKWYLRHQPRGETLQTLYSKRLVDISKAPYKGLVVNPIPIEVLQSTTQIILNSHNIPSNLHELVSSFIIYSLK
ncbi:uncharacterized protein CMU_003680 [Cryptosporidium muris RN66]|uniref:Uncharacterized protein n=1 Tax=Cryptosporidium muris (strain RN66) TaxID=441375 RepID=B6AJY8_CRYMR|nr:uncharacterized protein CMU_003680 [Cryptosporidium muris RN66]EEA08529.1 hypothetical protein CMU_003680 [Cryptosporidium muris RN66]|eukprot:XP_002142878.1 hypothetical protein [Cryptosporidium muris RN66]